MLKQKKKEKVITLDLNSSVVVELKNADDLYTIYHHYMIDFDFDLKRQVKSFSDLDADDIEELKIMRFVLDNSDYIFDNLESGIYELSQLEVAIKELDYYG